MRVGIRTHDRFAVNNPIKDYSKPDHGYYTAWLLQLQVESVA